MGKKAFLLDVGRCSGCNLCTIACKDEHVGSAYAPWTKPQPETGHFWMRVEAIERGRMPRVKMSYLPLACQHCANAACVRACPERAIKTRDDGLVWIDPGACTGCGLCQPACPYDAIYMNAGLGVAQKCTGCAHRVDEELLPRCVEICPHDAIFFAPDGDSVFGPGADGTVAEAYHPEYLAAPRAYWRGLPQPWIAGSVIDAASEDVVAGAVITVLDLFDGESVSARADAFGDFWVHGLARGHKYRVLIGSKGYKDHLAIVTADREQDLGSVNLQRTG